MRKPMTAVLASIATLAAAAAAEAASIPITSVTTQQLLADFNVIVQNESNGNDIAGGVLVGGNLGPGAGPLNLSGVLLGTTPGTTAITGYGEINIFGNHSNVTNLSTGHVFVGGPSSGAFIGATSVAFSYAFPPGATPADNAATFQNNVWSKMTGLSTSLAGLSANSTFTIDSTHMLATFSPGAAVGPTTPAIFNVTLAQLNALTGFTLSFGGCVGAGTCDATIDVAGAGTFTQAFSYGALLAGQSNLIWNFEDASGLNLNHGAWWASILAPVGSISATADITGNVIAENYTTTAETHLPAFDCSDNLCSTPTPPPPVSEPGSLPLLAGALAALMAVASVTALRRRD